LGGQSQFFGTQVMFLYDDDFLYIGLRCRKVPGVVYQEDIAGPRQRDPDLRSVDRVEILLDVDRNYHTYYNMTIDYRGLAADSWAGDPSWNPTWFIAARQDDEFWMIEAAIPWEAFGGSFIESNNQKNPWAISLRRIVPGVGIECWNAENSFGLTEAFGLLIREEE